MKENPHPPSKETTPSSSQNAITGDFMRSKVSTDEYRKGWDRIFGKKDKDKKPPNKWIHD